MDGERIRRARAALEARGLDALICRLPENVLLLSGHWSLTGMAFLLFPAAGQPLCVLPATDEREAREELWDAAVETFTFGVLGAGNPFEEIGRILKGRLGGKRPGRVGWEAGFGEVAASWNAAEPSIPAAATRALFDDVFGAAALVDATGLLHELRALKTPAEQVAMRRASEIAAMGLGAFQRAVNVGVSGIELAALVEHEVAVKGTGYKGSRRVRAFAQVATGAAETSRGYRPMEISTTRALRAGDLALLELGVVADGFWADRTRVRVAGAPTAEQEKAYAAVRGAQEAAIDAARPGAVTGDVDEAARSVIRAAGYEKAFFHVTGHGIGLRYHEPSPVIPPGGTERLRLGMVHTVEPGIYIEGFGGMRVEDDVLITETGCEVLGPAPKGLAG